MPQKAPSNGDNRISVKEARKLLGALAKDMTDDQIEEVIINLQITARQFLNSAGSKN